MLSQQLNLFSAPPRPVAPTPAPSASPQTQEGRGWNKAAGPVSVTLTIPATDLPLLQEVVAQYLTKTAALRAGWGTSFAPNLVVEAGEPDAAEQVVATVRATHCEGWSPTPESAVWWFRSAVGVRRQDAEKEREARKEVAHV